jgi:hypothetical protein
MRNPVIADCAHRSDILEARWNIRYEVADARGDVPTARQRGNPFNTRGGGGGPGEPSDP